VLGEKKTKRSLVAGITLLLILSVLLLVGFQQMGLFTSTSEQPTVAELQQLPFFAEMDRLAQINGSLTSKVYPKDQRVLDAANQSIHIEVYVTDVYPTVVLSQDIRTNKTEGIINVYRPTERIVKQLLEVPNTYFYVDDLNPSIVMEIDKQNLQRIEDNPAVYCIRVVGQAVLCSFADVREPNGIEQKMAL
jgi:hypothetical protein